MITCVPRKAISNLIEVVVLKHSIPNATREIVQIHPNNTLVLILFGLRLFDWCSMSNSIIFKNVHSLLNVKEHSLLHFGRGTLTRMSVSSSSANCRDLTNFSLRMAIASQNPTAGSSLIRQCSIN